MRVRKNLERFLYGRGQVAYGSSKTYSPDAGEF